MEGIAAICVQNLTILGMALDFFGLGVGLFLRIFSDKVTRRLILPRRISGLTVVTDSWSKTSGLSDL